MICNFQFVNCGNSFKCSLLLLLEESKKSSHSFLDYMIYVLWCLVRDFLWSRDRRVPHWSVNHWRFLCFFFFFFFWIWIFIALFWPMIWKFSFKSTCHRINQPSSNKQKRKKQIDSYALHMPKNLVFMRIMMVDYWQSMCVSLGINYYRSRVSHTSIAQLFVRSFTLVKHVCTWA